MIKSFTHRGLKKLYETGKAGSISSGLVQTVEEILTVLDAAATPQALNLPGYKFHMLTGNLKRFYSVKVSGPWRIIFRFQDGSAFDVNLIDYH